MIKRMREWGLIAWRKLERRVFKLQTRIFKASARGDVKAVGVPEWDDTPKLING